MNACNQQTFPGRLAESGAFQIKLAGTPEAATSKSTAEWREVSTGRREVSTDYVSAAELYGCVDWYQYPGQGKREPDNTANPGAEH